MTAVVVKKGTILIPSGTDANPDKNHLHIICNDPCANGQVLLVSISSVNPNSIPDETCFLNAGDHRFIKHKSFVKYSKSRLYYADNLLSGLNASKFKLYDPVVEYIFLKIKHGIIRSIHTPRKIKQYAVSVMGMFPAP